MVTAPGSASATAPRRAGSRPSRISRQPRGESERASARPRPRDAPVMSATGVDVMQSMVIVEVNLKSSGRRSMRTTDLLTVGELSERSGVAASALRFYEGEGLIDATRTSGNQRRYQRG